MCTMTDNDSAPVGQRAGPPGRTAEQWLTYQQAGEMYGVSAEAIRQHARRLGWRRQPGNDGKTLILVPPDTDLRTRVRPAEHQPDGAAEQRPDENSTIRELAGLLAAEREDRAALLADLRAARTAVDQANERANTAEVRVVQTEARISAAAEMTAQAQAAAEAAEGEASIQRERADTAEGQAQAARDAQRAAQDEAARLRQAEEARRRLGRWARLRAAWRGE